MQYIILQYMQYICCAVSDILPLTVYVTAGDV